MSTEQLGRLRLSQHGYERMIERITHMSFSEAQEFAREEIKKSKVFLLEMVENGLKEMAFIYKDTKYIVQNNTIITVYTLY